jgi:DNA-binding response OmpR family regulator
MIRSALLLEDDRDLRMILCELFNAHGARCVGVSSVDELKDLVTEGGLAFDLAILDVNLGEGRPSGVDAYRWLREQGYSGRVVFMTGHGRTSPSVADAMALGVGVLEKPVPVHDLLGLFGAPL